MPTPPFGDAFEASLKEVQQGGRFHIEAGFVVNPVFACCISGTTVGVAKNPMAVLSVSPRTACTGQAVTADYSNSWSPSSTINTWSIAWGDGQTSNGAWPGAGTVNHPLGGYVLAGSYTVTLTVTDLLGATGVATAQINAVDCSTITLPVFAACGTSGVWYSETGGLSWGERSGGGVLSGVPIYDLKQDPFTRAVYDESGGVDIGNVGLWAATASGLYRSVNGGGSWEVIELPEPGAGLGSVTPRSVRPSRTQLGVTFVLADTAAGRPFLYRTDNNGVTWTYIDECKPDYMYMYAGNSLAGTDPVYRRPSGQSWASIGSPGAKPANCYLNGGIVYWNERPYTTRYNSIAGGGGVYSYNGAAWVLFAALEYPTGITVLDSGNLAVIESNVLSTIAGNDAQGIHPAAYVRIYNTAGALANTLTLPNITHGGPPVAAIGFWRYITQYDGDIFVSAQEYLRLANALFPVFQIVRWTGAAFAIEHGPVTDPRPSNFLEYNGRLWTATEPRGAATYDVPLVRNDGAATWALDTVSGTGGWAHWLAEWDDELYVQSQSSIYRRESTGWVKESDMTAVNFYSHVAFRDELFSYRNSDGLTGVVSRYDYDAEDWDDESLSITPPSVAQALHTVSSYFAFAGFVPGRTPGDGGLGGSSPASTYTIPPDGRTWLLDESSDGDYIYVALLDSGANPVIMRFLRDLSRRDILYAPGAGAWGGVVADTVYPERVWFFGDFGNGGVKVALSEDHGLTQTDVTDSGWAANEFVRPLLISPYAPRDLMAVLNTALESWRTRDTATNWGQIGSAAVPWGAQAGVRDWFDHNYAFIGRTAANADNIQLSVYTGNSWGDRSIPENAEVTSLIIL